MVHSKHSDSDQEWEPPEDEESEWQVGWNYAAEPSWWDPPHAHRSMGEVRDPGTENDRLIASINVGVKY